MALNPLPTANNLKQRLDAANPNDLPDGFRLIKIGTTLRRLRVSLRRQNPVAAPANPYFGAVGAGGFAATTYHVITLPDDAKAGIISSGGVEVATASEGAYVRSQDAGQTTGGLGGYPLMSTPYTLPTTGKVAIMPCGDIGFLATDGVNDVDIVYEPVNCDVVEVVLPVTPGTGLCVLPASIAPAGPGKPGLGGVVMMMEAESLAGTLISKMKVGVPTSSAPGTGNARLDVPMQNVYFAVADAVSQCRLKLGIVSSPDLNALLESASPIL